MEIPGFGEQVLEIGPVVTEGVAQIAQTQKCWEF